MIALQTALGPCRHRSLAGQSLRALRLDMHLLVIYHLANLSKGNYVCESAEAQDVEECIGALQRSACRTDEDIAPFLPLQKRAYVFGGMAATAARFVMWLLPELKVGATVMYYEILPNALHQGDRGMSELL